MWHNDVPEIESMHSSYYIKNIWLTHMKEFCWQTSVEKWFLFNIHISNSISYIFIATKIEFLYNMNIYFINSKYIYMYIYSIEIYIFRYLDYLRKIFPHCHLYNLQSGKIKQNKVKDKYAVYISILFIF